MYLKNQFKSWSKKSPERIIKQGYDTDGYLQVKIKRNNIFTTIAVHRLVGLAFLPEPSEELKQECLDSGINYIPINHKDNDPANPNINNLEWCSVSYNNNFSLNKFNQPKGSKVYNAILSEDDVVNIIKLLSSKVDKMSQTEIANLYNVKQITISNIWTGRSWNHVTGFPTCPRSELLSKRESKRISES